MSPPIGKYLRCGERRWQGHSVGPDLCCAGRRRSSYQCSVNLMGDLTLPVRHPHQPHQRRGCGRPDRCSSGVDHETDGPLLIPHANLSAALTAERRRACLHLVVSSLDALGPGQLVLSFLYED